MVLRIPLVTDRGSERAVAPRTALVTDRLLGGSRGERAHCGAENNLRDCPPSWRTEHRVVPRIALVTSHGERARGGAGRLCWRERRRE